MVSCKPEKEKQVKKKQGIASYKTVSEEIAEDGKTAVVKVEFTYGNGSTDTEKYDLKLVDGAWKPYIKKSRNKLYNKCDCTCSGAVAFLYSVL